MGPAVAYHRPCPSEPGPPALRPNRRQHGAGLLEPAGEHRGTVRDLLRRGFVILDSRRLLVSDRHIHQGGRLRCFPFSHREKDRAVNCLTQASEGAIRTSLVRLGLPRRARGVADEARPEFMPSLLRSQCRGVAGSKERHIPVVAATAPLSSGRQTRKHHFRTPVAEMFGAAQARRFDLAHAERKPF